MAGEELTVTRPGSERDNCDEEIGGLQEKTVQKQDRTTYYHKKNKTCFCVLLWTLSLTCLALVVFVAVVIGVVVSALRAGGSEPTSIATSSPPPQCLTRPSNSTKWFQSNEEVLEAVCWLGIPRDAVDWYRTNKDFNNEDMDPCGYFHTPVDEKEIKRQEVLNNYGSIEDWYESYKQWMALRSSSLLICLIRFLPAILFLLHRRFEPSVSSLAQLFSHARSFNEDIRCWNVNSIEDFSGLFSGARSFGFDLNSWIVSSGTNFRYMFAGADNFNFHLSSWNMSSAITLEGMFFGASSFNGNVTSWDTSKVTSMNSMFWFATHFNQDVSSWKVSNVADFESMFTGAYAFDQNITGWDVSSGRDFRSMFAYADAFNQDISVWRFNSRFNQVFPVNIDRMFYGAESFNQDLCAWGKQMTSFEGNEVFEDTSCPDLSSPIDTDGGTDTSNGNSAWCHPCAAF